MKIVSVKQVTLEQPKQYYDVINANPYNNFLIQTDSGYVCSHNCFADEVNFQNVKDVEKAKKKSQMLVNESLIRMQSRFMKGDKNPTIMCIASSKDTEQSYMESFIQQKKQQESKTTLIVDEPQWVIRDDKDSPEKFQVAVGNKFLESEVLPLHSTEDVIQDYKDRGYGILNVPMGYYESFLSDIDKSLTDIAGISTTSSSRYISGTRLKEVKDESFENPFNMDIIEVGNGVDDVAQYCDFFDLSKVPYQYKEKPLFIHLDMSISGDKTGIGGVWIIGKTPPKPGELDSSGLFFQTAFSVSVKAPKGHQVSFEKNRQFIYWLREQGFNIQGITSDTFQSYDTGQSLIQKGYNYEVLSVDRVDSDRICKPYQYFKSTIYEKRIRIYAKGSGLLTEEIIGLERDNHSGKIDHTPSGINSKDQADAVCAATYNASKHGEEYAYDFGETLETIFELNQTENFSKEQITLDFEEMLKQTTLFGQKHSQTPRIEDDGTVSMPGFQIDFGAGKARKDIEDYYFLTQGIII